MSAVDTQFYDKKKSSSIIIAIIFLIAVIAGTATLYWMNIQMKHEITEIRSETMDLSDSIRQEKASDLVATYSTYDKYRNEFELLERRSNIPDIANHLKSITRSYGLDSRGFSFTAGELSTSIQTSSNSSTQAYQNIVNFSREYPQKEDALFLVKPVFQYSGHDEMGYSASFTLK